MMVTIGKRGVRRQTVLLRVAMLAMIGLVAGSLTKGLADEPKPDPAGISTGDKTTVVDAGGNSFVVSEPTDQKDPDYATKKSLRRVPGAGRERTACRQAGRFRGTCPASHEFRVDS